MSSASIIVIDADARPTAIFTHDRLADAWIAAQVAPEDYSIYCDESGEPAVFLRNPKPEPMEEPSGEFGDLPQELTADDLAAMSKNPAEPKCSLCDGTYRVSGNRVCEDCLAGIPG